jgi:hypothetical protein
LAGIVKRARATAAASRIPKLAEDGPPSDKLADDAGGRLR